MSDFPYAPAETEEAASERAYLLMRAGYQDLPARSRARLSLRDLDVLTKHLRWHYMQAEYQRRALALELELEAARDEQ